MKRPLGPRLGLAARYLPILALGGALALSCNLVVDDKYCAKDENCNVAAGEFCDEVKHSCETLMRDQCRRDEQCTKPEAPQCDRQLSRCVPCLPPEGEGRSPVCEHIIRAERPRPFCVMSGVATLCAECQRSADCPVQRPICDGFACRSCGEHKECGPEVTCDDGKDERGKLCRNSWVCIGAEDGPEFQNRAGRCASNSPTTGHVVYAQKFTDMTDRCNDMWPGSPDQPVCTLDAAVARASGDKARLRYVRLLGTIFPPLGAPLSGDLRLVIIGAETKALSRATVEGATTLFQIGGGADITLDQIKLVQDGANMPAVSCTSGVGMRTALTLKRSFVLGATGAAVMNPLPAINVSDCDTQLLSNYIGAMMEGQPAHSLGVRLLDNSGRSYRVVGNIIAGNFGPALFLSATNLEFRYNTIVKNGRMGFAGIDCQFGARLGQSIIADNTTIGGSQFSGSCSFDQVVAGGTEMSSAMGLVKSAPGLDKRFHLQASSVACLDQIVSQPGPTQPTRDIDGDLRPQGEKLDIGADELVR